MKNRFQSNLPNFNPNPIRDPNSNHIPNPLTTDNWNLANWNLAKWKDTEKQATSTNAKQLLTALQQKIFM